MKKEKSTKGFVYVLLSKDKKIFKIGSTDNLRLRVKALQKFWGDFDLDDCFALECDREFKFRLESTLLNLLSDSQVVFDEGEKEHGYTEFFYIEAFPLLNKIVKEVLPICIKDLKKIELKDLI